MKKDPEFTAEQIEHFRHICLNEIVKCYKECCVLREYEKRMKKHFQKLMKEARKEDKGDEK